MDRDIRSIHNNTNSATALFNRKVRDLIPDVEINHGGYDTLWTYAMIVHGCKIGNVKEGLYHCRRHAGRVVNRKGSPEWDKERILKEQYLEELRRVGLSERIHT